VTVLLYPTLASDLAPFTLPADAETGCCLALARAVSLVPASAGRGWNGA